MAENNNETTVANSGDVATKPVVKFTKEKFMNGAAYKDKRDLIAAILEAGKEYTKAEVEKLIAGYLQREVDA